MYLPRTNKRLYNLLALFALMLFIALEVTGCKDMEDCRSLYNEAILRIQFKGSSSLAMNKVEVELFPAGGKKSLENIFNSEDNKKFLKTVFTDMKKNPLPILLTPTDSVAKVWLYKTPTDPNPHTITIHYQVNHSLLSPNCGIQVVYVIERIETSFKESTILAAGGKMANYNETKKPHVEISY